MIAVHTAAVATQIIGAVWALLALTYHDPEGRHPWLDFGVGITVIAAGFAIWLAARWWEHRR